MNIQECKLISLPKITDPRGNLTFIESYRHIPFEIKRIYYLYDVPGKASRGGHAHLKLQQIIIAVNGSFDILLDDGKTKKVVTLNCSNEGLLVNNFIWREMFNFSSGSVCLVLASDIYDESDYIRDYNEFIKISQKL